MRPEHGKRIAVRAVEDGFDFLRSHAQLLWQGSEQAEVRNRVSHMKRAELHVHLEGSIGAETLLAIDPSLTREEIEAHLTCASFPEFLQGYIWVTKKLESPEHYALATRHLLESLAGQEVTYAEITLSAGVVLWKQQDLAAVYDAVWRESQRSSIRTFWILDAIRNLARRKDWKWQSLRWPGETKEPLRMASAAMKRADRRTGSATCSRTHAMEDCIWFVTPERRPGRNPSWARWRLGRSASVTVSPRPRLPR